MNGFGSGWLIPSALTWCSSIDSNSADCALGEARLSSSARQDVGEHRPGPERDLPAVAVEDHGPGDIGGEEVGGELHPPEGEVEGPGQGLGQCRLAHPGMVFDQEMALGHETAQRQAHGAVPAHIGAAHVGHDGVEGRGPGAPRRRAAASGATTGRTGGAGKSRDGDTGNNGRAGEILHRCRSCRRPVTAGGHGVTQMRARSPRPLRTLPWRGA